jgi:integrase
MNIDQCAGLMFITKRKNIWYLYWTDEDGRRRKKSTGCESKSDALKFLSSFDPSSPPDLEKPASNILLSNFRDEYIEYSKSTHTVKSTKSCRTAFNEFIRITGDLPIRSIDVRRIEYFIAVKLNEASPWTASKYYATLASAFETAVRWGMLKKNIFRSVKRPRIPESRPVFFSREQFNILLSVIDHAEVRDIIIFAVSTGCRQKEILTLRWKGVDTKRRVIDVVNYSDFITKSKKSRTIPMSKHLCRLLDIRRGRSTGELVFYDRRRPWEPEKLSKLFKQYVRAAGLPDELRFHSLRHTFASWLVEARVPLYEISRLLGHSTYTVTEKYAHLKPENLHDTVEKISINI